MQLMSNSNKGHIASLTGLRGLAAWLVVVYHFRDVFRVDFPGVERFFSYGFYAVDLFFVLSGFVIYLNTFQYFQSERWSWSLKKFYLDRFSRIYPLHIFLLLLFLANPLALTFFSSTGFVASRYSLEYFIASVFLVQNWGLFDALGWNIPAWSISSEFAAYLIYPFLFFLVSFFKSAWSLIAFLSLVLSLFIYFHIAVGIDSIGADITKVGTVRCMFEFLMGVVISRMYMLGYIKLSRLPVALIQILAVLVLMALLAASIKDYFFVPAVICLFVISLVGGEGIVSHVLGSRMLCHLGVISYSVYLVHYLVKDWVKFLSHEVGYLQFGVYILATYVASIALYQLIEMPARLRLKSILVRA